MDPSPFAKRSAGGPQSLPPKLRRLLLPLDGGGEQAEGLLGDPAWVEAALEAIGQTAPAQVDDPRHWPLWRTLHPYAVRLLERARQGPPSHRAVELEVRVAMLELLAWGDAPASEERLRWAGAAAATLPAQRTRSGFDHRAVETSRLNLALVLHRSGRSKEAIALVRELLAEQQARLGEDDPQLASTLNNLSTFLLDLDRNAEAEPLIRRAVALAEATDPPHPALGTRLHNLADCLRKDGRPAEAEPFARRALAWEEARFGPDHPEVASELTLLGKLLAAQGKIDEAYASFERALEIHGEEEATLRPRLQIAHEVSELARLADHAGRRQEAILLAARALAIHELEPGPQFWTAADLNLLGIWFQEAGLLEAAEKAKRRALAINETILHPTDPELGITLNNLGHLLIEAGRTEEAEPLLRRALAIAEAAQPPDPQLVADRIDLLADALRHLGRRGEAAALTPAPPKFPFH